MKTVNVAELEGAALDWVVAQIDPMCNGLAWEVVPGGKVGFAVISGEKTPCAFLSHGSCLSERMRLKRDGVQAYSPSTDWSQCGQLIESHAVSVIEIGPGLWFASSGDAVYELNCGGGQDGPAPLIAACRAIVAAKFGDTVEVPEELL